MLAVSTVADREPTFLDACSQGRDRITVQRVAGDHHFQAVVVGRIVASGDHDAGAGAQFVGREIEHAGGHHANVDDVHARGLDSRGQCPRQVRAGKPAVAPDDDGRNALAGRLAADRLTDGLNDFGCKCPADDATDVVGLEDLTGEVHG